MVTRYAGGSSNSSLTATPPGDAELLEAFEAGSLPAGHFRHADHVRVVWLFLAKGSVLQVLERFPASLRRYAASVGHPDLYHETITWALILLIHARRRGGPPGASWQEFAAGNADLFSWPGVLDRYYRPGTLATRDAKEFFLLPDRIDTESSTPETSVGGAAASG